jgi:hypothetical protein
MQYRYTGTDERIYPSARIDGHSKPLLVKPGMAPVDMDEPPADGRWEQVQEVPPAPKKAPVAAKAAPQE